MKNVSLLVKGTGGDLDRMHEPAVPLRGELRFGHDGAPRFASPWGFATSFPLLPAAAVAAGTEKNLIALGTGTEVIARSAKGGVNVKTQATTPADNDNALLIGIANTYSVLPITARSKIFFSTRVNLTQITELVFGAGLDENLTSPIGAATAGDGAQFYFDPENEVNHSLDSAAHDNFILATKVNGVDAYLDSGVRVIAGRDYELAIQIGEDLKANYYIDGKLVGTSVASLTSGDSVGAVIGVQINANPPAGQKDFDVRYVEVERQIG
jgi:hypothetical protein